MLVLLFFLNSAPEREQVVLHHLELRELLVLLEQMVMVDVVLLLLGRSIDFSPVLLTGQAGVSGVVVAGQAVLGRVQPRKLLLVVLLVGGRVELLLLSDGQIERRSCRVQDPRVERRRH